jgi:hypothetical protein
MVTRLHLALALLMASACGDGELTPEESLSKSCAGEVIPNCRPYEYGIVREGSVAPDGVEVGDPLATVDVRFVIDGCSDAPMAHAVRLIAIDENASTPDGGTTGRMTILDTFRDGSSRDDDPDIGVFEGTVENFFLTTLVEPMTDLTLTFEPQIDVCTGGTVDLSYRTGPAYEMSGP